MASANEPTTLQEAILLLTPIPRTALPRWQRGAGPMDVVVPDLRECRNVRFLANQKRVEVQRVLHKQFSVKVGTIFEDSPIGLDKWLTAIWMVANCKNGVSVLAKFTAPSASPRRPRGSCSIGSALRCRMSRCGKLSGQVEVDETFIGGKARNMHKDVKARKIQGGLADRRLRLSSRRVLERGGKVSAKVIDNRRKKQLQALVRENVETGSALFYRRAEVLRRAGRRVRASGRRSRD